MLSLLVFIALLSELVILLRDLEHATSVGVLTPGRSTGATGLASFLAGLYRAW
jgi:hypothetical protein